jgi:hypothetical protein
VSLRSLVLVLGFTALPLLALGLARAARPVEGRARREGLLAGGMAGLSLLALLLVLEVGFQHLVVYSDGFGQTLAARAWFRRYWGPPNAHGFRDGPVAPEGRHLFVVGDSFVAGHGVADRAARFPDRLASHLVPGWSVVNFARNGWGTGQQLEALRTFPVEPDALVWSHYVNDIEGAAARQGRGAPPARLTAPRGLAWLVDRSYLANFVYWRVFRVTHGALGARRWARQREAYRDGEVWRAHRRELAATVAFARERDLPMVAVVFPMLVDVEGSRVATRRVAGFFRERGVPVVEVEEVVGSGPPSAWTVNAMDAHPNERLHAEVAARLLPHLAQAGIARVGVAAAREATAGHAAR